MSVGSLLRRLVEALTRRDGYEFWDVNECNKELAESGLRPRLDGESEDIAFILLGQPTEVIEDSPTPSDVPRRVYPQGRWLVYNDLLKKSSIQMRVVDGLIYGVSIVPKLKRCPPDVSRQIGSYHSPQ